MQTGRVSDALTNATRTFENYICVASFCKKTVLLQVQRKEIESHLQEAVRPHVDFAFAKLTSTQEELKRSQDLISKLNEKFKDLERQLKLFEAKFNDQQLIIRRLSSNGHGEKVNALERKVGTFQTQLEKRAVELEDRVETVEMILKDDSKKVDSLEKSFRLLQRPLNPMQRVEQKESTSMYKDFAIQPGEEICVEIRSDVWKKEWRIPDFSGFITRATLQRGYEVESNPFYLGKNGYKCKLYMGKSNLPLSRECINIYFVIMKSENDIILRWPFNKTVTLELTGQQKIPGKECRNFIQTCHSPVLLSEGALQRPVLEENKRSFRFFCSPSAFSCGFHDLNNVIINVVVSLPVQMMTKR